MSAEQLPTEIWDRIFDCLPFPEQLDKALVCRAWSQRVARRATFALSCPSYSGKEHLGALQATQRRYKSFYVEFLRTKQEYHAIRRALQVCGRKFVAQRLRIGLVSSEMFGHVIQKHFQWLSTVRDLNVQLCDDEPFPVEALRWLTNLRELRLLNVCDTGVRWDDLCRGLEHIRVLTVDAAWHYNDEALGELVESVATCKNLRELTIRSNDTASLAKLADSLNLLTKLSLVRLTVQLVNDGVLNFPSLRQLNFDIGWFVFDKPQLTINAPVLQSLKIPKKILPFVKFSEQTRISQLDLFGHSISSAHVCFASVSELTLTVWEPANAEAVLDEIGLFPNVTKLAVKLLSKECAIAVPSASTFKHIRSLYLNNFVLSIGFFEELAQMKLLQQLTVEECNFFLDLSGPLQVHLAHLEHFRVKRVSMPQAVEAFPVTAAPGQPPIVVVDKLRTHLWRNDHFNVFSSRWE